MKTLFRFPSQLLGLAVCLMMIPFGASAQQVQVRGTVTGADDGEPIMGGSVMVKGTTIGVATGLDGTYSISVDRNATLVFNSVGYVTEEVAVNGRSTIDVVLAVDRELLDDVLVVGYAVGNKRSVSGAVERVTAEQMNQGLISTPIDALMGKVPGLVITQAGGSVLGTPTVRVRGTSSLSGGSDPLVIIDGIFSDMATFQSLPVSDIKEVSLLKDASETAQYGSRGSAGVIVVSTNKGEEGKTSVEYTGQFGVSMAYKNPEVLDGDAWRETTKKYFNGVGNDMGYNTNWVEFVQNKFVPQNNHSISFSQGTSKSTMRASIGYNDRQGTLKGARNSTFNMSFNASTKAFDNKLVFELGARLSRNTRYNPAYGWSSALQFNPTFPTFRNPDTGMWDADPGASFTTNPGESGETIRTNMGYRIMVNGRVTWNIIEGLTLSASGNYTTNPGLARNYTPNDLTSTYASTMGTASITGTYGESLMGNIQLSYVKKLGKHEINALALAEAQSTNSFSFNASSSGYGTNKFKWNNLQAGATVVKSDVGSSASDSRILSYMGRINYMYDNRYVVTVNLRTDGSSKLGANYKWGFFPSASVAWVASNEQFMKDWGFFSTLKFRLGYGVTGNQNSISAYRSIQTMTPTGTTEYNGKVYETYSIDQNPNPDLKWETKATLDAGVDFSMLKSRLRGTIDWYKSNTRDLLYTYQVPVPPFAYGTLLANMGELENKGIEIALTGDIIKTQDWALTVGANFASSKNTLISLHGTYQGQELTTAEYVTLSTIGGQGLTQNNEGTVMKEGWPVAVFYLPVHAGFATNEKGYHTYTYKDVDGDGEVNPVVGKDREVVGQVMPKFTANLNVNLRYKRFDLQAQASGAFGHKIFNQIEMNMNDLAQFPTYNISPRAIERNIMGKSNSSYWLENGDYVNISYISIGYNIPTRALRNIQSARVAISCNNVGTITKYTGLTPMIDSQSLTGGIDNNVDPIMRTFALQVSVKF